MKAEDSADLRRALEELQALGILLHSDATLPSVSSLVAGEPVRGSWWSHPRANDIYEVVEGLDHHPGVIVAKLVSGKNTYVHRRLWSAIIAIGVAREPWQLEGLSSMAERLLKAVTEQGELRTDEIPWAGGPKKDSPGEGARQLERKLLVQSEEVHTETGAHAKRLETWERWANRVDVDENEMTPEQGRKALEDVVAGLNERFRGKGRLPWQ